MPPESPAEVSGGLRGVGGKPSGGLRLPYRGGGKPSGDVAAACRGGG